VKKKTLNEWRDDIFAWAEKAGHHKNVNFSEKLMLTVSELSEAQEADRKGNWLANTFQYLASYPKKIKDFEYANSVKGTVEEEIADAIIRFCDIAGIYGIDLDAHVEAKMAYNEANYHKSEKKY
jgi:NTP pyrophosphatase (non-canonical NTP hydrolase)